MCEYKVEHLSVACKRLGVKFLYILELNGQFKICLDLNTELYMDVAAASGAFTPSTS